MASKKKRALIRQFKNELKARLEYQTRITELENRIVLLESKLAVHSPALTDIHYSKDSRDAQLAEYVTRKQRYTDELEALQAQADKVDSKLALMDQEVVHHLKNVYLGKYTMEEAGRRMHLTEMQFRSWVDREILKAHDLI